MKRKLLKIQFLILQSSFWIILFTSCEGKNSSLTEMRIRKMIPNSMEVYAPYKKYLLDSSELSHLQSPMIVSFVNVSCPTCIGGLSEIQKLIPEFWKFKVPIVLICDSKDNFEYFKFLIEQKTFTEFPFPFYLNKQSNFRQRIDSLSNGSYNYLTDKNNNIILTGDLIHSAANAKAFIDKIREIK